MRIFPSLTFLLVPLQPRARLFVKHLKTGLAKKSFTVRNLGVAYLVTESEKTKEVAPGALKNLREEIKRRGVWVLG